jgi:hypothetical protein
VTGEEVASVSKSRAGVLRNPAEVITLAVAVAIAGAAVITADSSPTGGTVTADGHSTTQSRGLDERQLTGPYVSGRSSARASVKGLDDESQSGSDVTAAPPRLTPGEPGTPSWVGSPSGGLEGLSPWVTTRPLSPLVSRPPSQLAEGGAGRGDAPPGRGADSAGTPSTASRPDATGSPSPAETTAPAPEPSTEAPTTTPPVTTPPLTTPPVTTPPLSTPPEETPPATTPTAGVGTPDPGTTPDAGQAVASPTASPTASAEATSSQSPLTLPGDASVPAHALNPVQADRLP